MEQVMLRTKTLGDMPLVDPYPPKFLPACEICWVEQAWFEGKTRQIHSPWAYACKKCVKPYLFWGMPGFIVARSIRAVTV